MRAYSTIVYMTKLQNKLTIWWYTIKWNLTHSPFGAFISCPLIILYVKKLRNFFSVLTKMSLHEYVTWELPLCLYNTSKLFYSRLAVILLNVLPVRQSLFRCRSWPAVHASMRSHSSVVQTPSLMSSVFSKTFLSTN